MSDAYHEWEDQELLKEHEAHPERFHVAEKREHDRMEPYRKSVYKSAAKLMAYILKKEAVKRPKQQ